MQTDAKQVRCWFQAQKPDHGVDSKAHNPPILELLRLTSLIKMLRYRTFGIPPARMILNKLGSSCLNILPGQRDIMPGEKTVGYVSAVCIFQSTIIQELSTTHTVISDFLGPGGAHRIVNYPYNSQMSSVQHASLSFSRRKDLQLELDYQKLVLAVARFGDFQKVTIIELYILITNV